MGNSATKLNANLSNGVHYIELAKKPLLIVELTKAQITSPKLIKVANKYIKNLTTTGASYSKPAIFGQIQQYLHDHTYHMVRRDRVEFFGWDKIVDLNKKFGKKRVDKSLDIIIDQLTKTGRQELADAWVAARAEGKCLSGRNVVFDKSCDFGRRRRNKPALQCGDETTVAAALCVLKAGIALDKLIFVGSSFHTLVFVDLSKGYLFDSKMLYTTTNLPKLQVQDYFSGALGELEWLATTNGYWDLAFAKGSLSKVLLLQALSELAKFADRPLKLNPTGRV